METFFAAAFMTAAFNRECAYPPAAQSRRGMRRFRLTAFFPDLIVPGMLLSVHIPKTAGSSFLHVLRQIYAGTLAEDYADRIAHPLFPLIELKNRVLRIKPAVPPGTECIHGHFFMRKYVKLFPRAEYATWLREPADRVASLYYYWLDKPKMFHPLCRKLHRRRWSLEEFAAVPQMRDLQARMLDPLAIEDFHFVGITEEFDRGLKVFRELTGTAREITVAPQRVSPRRDRPGGTYDLDPAVRERILELNPRDREAYDRARKCASELYREHDA